MHGSLNNIVEALCHEVSTACDKEQPLHIIGNNTKSFYGHALHARQLCTNKLAGIINYQPSELVITAYAGTPIAEINQLLKSNQQMLAFEPPEFNAQATLGGTIAADFAGPARAFNGSISDYLLGCHIINGKGEYLRFGGEVIKNVAGYDVSRLMCGALGTLGIITQASLKVLPCPEYETTYTIKTNQTKALQILHQLINKSYPVSASCYVDDYLYVRFSGSRSTVNYSIAEIDGKELVQADTFWTSIREKTHTFFAHANELWRVSLPATTVEIDLPKNTTQLTEWLGGLRWLKIEGNDRPDIEAYRHYIESLGGHVILYKTESDDARFHPLTTAQLNIHRRLKQSFDPASILNPGKMYSEF